MEKFKFLTKERISRLPKTPGVYLFKKGTKFLYIGKAANIKERVKNHFQQPTFRDRLMFNQVKHIGFIKTNSEIEALILEANLIKKHQPKYNVVWKDDKNYFFVAKTIEDFPRIFITHQPRLKIGNWRSKRGFSASPSLLPAEARKLKIDYVGPFVDGKALKETLKILRKVFPYRTCKNLPKNPCLWYHLNRCPAPCFLKERVKNECQRNTKNLMKIIQKGKIQVFKDLKKEMKKASTAQDYERAAKIRDQITVWKKVLAHTGRPEPTAQAVGGQAKIFEWRNIEKELKKILETKKKISRIEAYDVSNIQGQEATGSMVTFINGKPDKNFYRKFKIKISGKPDDIAMLKEVLNRRFKHPEWPFPDLILIDGGRAQLNVGLRCLTPGVKHLEIIALAKRKNELFIRGQEKPILLKSLPREIFNLILQMRDEAHRFAIGYHKRLREKAMFELAD